MLMFCIFWKCLYWFFNEFFWFSKKIENKIVEKIFWWQNNNIFSWNLFCWKGGVPNITKPLSLRVLEQDTDVLFQNVQNWDFRKYCLLITDYVCFNLIFFILNGLRSRTGSRILRRWRNAKRTSSSFFFQKYITTL